jgi:predicted acetyltransferase
MSFEVKPADISDKPALEQLMQFYLYDFAEFEADEMNDVGRYTYPYLDFYWQEPDRHPFIFLSNGNLAGFALVRHNLEPTDNSFYWEMAEFFIVRRYRRLSYGAAAAKNLWQHFPGNWQLRVLDGNLAGYLFWQPLIQNFTNNAYSESKEERGTAFCFEVATEQAK